GEGEAQAEWGEDAGGQAHEGGWREEAKRPARREEARAMRRSRHEDTEDGNHGESERRHGESRRAPCPARAVSAVPLGHAHLRAEHTVAWQRARMASSIRRG